jgi:hypothetical protein
VKIHTLSSRPQYQRHCEAIWRHVPPELKGESFHGPKARADRLPPEDVVLVGGAIDIDVVPNRIIYVEHGAGQTYTDITKPATAAHYPGGKHPSRVIGYVCPNNQVALAWDRPTIVVGCPALDGIQPQPRMPMVCALTFHWDAYRVSAEARSARDHYAEHLHMIVQWLRSHDVEPLGHWHPNDTTTKIMWDHLQIRTEPDIDNVLEQATFMIVDNSSAGYEANHVGIDTLWLNAPWYRKEVEHGLRFWDQVPGPQFDDAWQLVEYPLTSPFHRAKWLLKQDLVDDHVYPVKSGGGKIAADWIVELLS